MAPKSTAKPTVQPEFVVVAGKKLTKGQLAYEQERAKNAGKSIDEWLKAKAKNAAVEAQKTAPKPAKRPGLISRLLDRAHKPI